MMPTLRRGDWVYVRCKSPNPRPGMIKRVAKDSSWADIDFGMWSKRMKTDWLVKPKEILVPGLSGDSVFTFLVQPDGEDWELLREQ